MSKDLLLKQIRRLPPMVLMLLLDQLHSNGVVIVDTGVEETGGEIQVFPSTLFITTSG